MMLRFILIAALILVLYYVLHLLIRDMPSAKKKIRRAPDPEELVQDAYCKTYIPKRIAVRGRGNGKDYYFCSRECFENFLKNTP